MSCNYQLVNKLQLYVCTRLLIFLWDGCAAQCVRGPKHLWVTNLSARLHAFARHYGTGWPVCWCQNGVASSKCLVYPNATGLGEYLPSGSNEYVRICHLTCSCILL